MKVFFVILGLFLYASATRVRQCPNIGRTIEGLENRVQIGNCKKPPCRLRKDHTINVSLKFVADADITNLKTAVSADILGVPFPFVGVDGEDACDKIFGDKGKVKVGCNLEKGKEYEFKSGIEVLKIYPKIKTDVTWGLKDQTGRYVTCFLVGARITD